MPFKVSSYQFLIWKRVATIGSKQVPLSLNHNFNMHYRIEIFAKELVRIKAKGGP
jgi:hypothetical protein